MDLRLLENYPDRSRAVDLDGVDWNSIPKYPVPAEVVRTLRYMQDIESHTIVYLRELLATRAIDEPEVCDFLACWIFEESAHGRALQRFLQYCGESTVQRNRSELTPWLWFQERMIGVASRLWSDFVAVHMTWGAINELTTLQGYVRLAELAGHPVLDDLLGRIARDESRHFSFYFHQARRRLSRPKVAPVVRFLLKNFWSPVGSNVQPDDEVRFLAGYVFSGDEGRAAARKVDQTIRSLPGLEDLPLLESWLAREVDRC